MAAMANDSEETALSSVLRVRFLAAHKLLISFFIQHLLSVASFQTRKEVRPRTGHEHIPMLSWQFRSLAQTVEKPSAIRRFDAVVVAQFGRLISLGER